MNAADPTVACPYCGAIPGQYCRDGGGNPMIHDMRKGRRKLQATRDPWRDVAEAVPEYQADSLCHALGWLLTEPGPEGARHRGAVEPLWRALTERLADREGEPEGEPDWAAVDGKEM